MMSVRFASPWMFLLLLPLAVAAWRMLRRPSRPRAVPFAAMRWLPDRGAGAREVAARVAPFAFLAAMLLFVVAAARPQTFFERQRRSADSIAIAMSVDVSGSMLALDLAKDPTASGAQTRLDVVKDEFASFISRRPDDLVTLVTFGGYASTRSPLTADHRALLQYLKEVHVPGTGDDEEGTVSNEETLTAVGDGLVMACARLQESDLKTKIAVLLSDGVSNTGMVEPDKAADIAKELGIRVYTIGVGSQTGLAPFRVKRFGRDDVAMGRVEFNEGELRNIAAKTGGRYYGVTERSDLDDIMKEIDSLEKTKVESEIFTNYSEKSGLPLAAGLILLAAALGMNLAVLGRPL